MDSRGNITVVLIVGALMAVIMGIQVIGTPVDETEFFAVDPEEGEVEADRSRPGESLQTLEGLDDSKGDPRIFCKWCGGFSSSGCREACKVRNYTEWRCALCTCQCRWQLV